MVRDYVLVELRVRPVEAVRPMPCLVGAHLSADKPPEASNYVDAPEHERHNGGERKDHAGALG